MDEPGIQAWFALRARAHFSPNEETLGFYWVFCALAQSRERLSFAQSFLFREEMENAAAVPSVWQKKPHKYRRICGYFFSGGIFRLKGEMTVMFCSKDAYKRESDLPELLYSMILARYLPNISAFYSLPRGKLINGVLPIDKMEEKCQFDTFAKSAKYGWLRAERVGQKLPSFVPRKNHQATVRL